jgi:ATP-dependent RNA helicase MSS116
MCFSATVPQRLKSVLGLALRDDHVVVDCVGEEDVDTHDRIIQVGTTHSHSRTHSLTQSLTLTHSLIYSYSHSHSQSLVVHPLEQTLLALYLTVVREMEARPDDYKILVFLPTARNAIFFTSILAELGLEVMEIHSRKNQAQRTQTSNAYREAKRAILMSSDISARGVSECVVCDERVSGVCVSEE